jgi:hypothetical protein
MPQLSDLASYLDTSEQGLHRVANGKAIPKKAQSVLSNVAEVGPFPRPKIGDVGIRTWPEIKAKLLGEGQRELFIFSTRSLPMDESDSMKEAFNRALMENSGLSIAYIFPAGGRASGSYSRWIDKLKYLGHVRGSVCAFRTSKQESSDADPDDSTQPIIAYNFASNLILLAPEAPNGDWHGYTSFPVGSTYAKNLAMPSIESPPKALWSEVEPTLANDLCDDIIRLRGRHKKIFRKPGIDEETRDFSP